MIAAPTPMQRSHPRCARRAERVRQFDAAIAATAMAHGIPVFTQDAEDFGLMERVISQLTVVLV